MVTTKDSIIVEMLAGKNTLIPEMQRVMKASQALGTLSRMGMDVSKPIENFKKHIKDTSPFMDAFNAGLKETKNRFDMNTLSWMFGGMALQRVSLMMMRFMIPSMDKLEKLNTAGAKKVMGMSAAFEFLKISIFETLSNTPMFKQFVEWIIKGALWLSEFAQKHPTITAIAAALAGIGVVLGTISMGVGIFMQLQHLITLLGIGGVAGEAATATTAVKALGAVKLSTLIASVGLLSAALVAAGFTLKKLKDDIDAMTASLTEQGAPKLEDSYLAGADNSDQLINNFKDFNLEWSNLRAGIDRTIGVQTTFNATTGEFNKHIITAQDELKGVNTFAQQWLEKNSLLNSGISEKLNPTIDNHINKLNSIPRNITTTITTKYVDERSGSSNSFSSSGQQSEEESGSITGG